jgi:hypothetical protein
VQGIISLVGAALRTGDPVDAPAIAAAYRETLRLVTKGKYFLIRVWDSRGVSSFRYIFSTSATGECERSANV